MRKQYSKSDIKQFLEEHPNAPFDKKSNVVEEDDTLFVNNKLLYFKSDGRWVPTLKLLLEKPDLLPQLTVDKGAIKFVVDGADIMRPGITACEAAQKDDFVVIVDETMHKPIAVGQLKVSSEELLAADSGKLVKNIHRISDDLWNAS